MSGSLEPLLTSLLPLVEPVVELLLGLLVVPPDAIPPDVPGVVAELPGVVLDVSVEPEAPVEPDAAEPPVVLELVSVLPDVLGVVGVLPDTLGLVVDMPPDVEPDTEPPVVLLPVLGDAAGVWPASCASRLHASKSDCVGSAAANAPLHTANTPTAVNIAVARVIVAIGEPPSVRTCLPLVRASRHARRDFKAGATGLTSGRSCDVECATVSSARSRECTREWRNWQTRWI